MAHATRTPLENLRPFELPDRPSGKFSFDLCVSVALTLDQDGDRQLYHGVRVAYIAGELAHMIALVDWPQVVYSALLHDIGGVYTDAHIVHKMVEFPSSLGQKADVDLFFHPSRGRELLALVPGMSEIARIVGSHQETIDGTGYPDGLQGEEVPIEAQLIHIADFLDQLLRTAGHESVEVITHNLRLMVGEEYTHELYEATVEWLHKDGVFETLQGGEHTLNEITPFRQYFANTPLFPTWEAVDRFFVLLSELVDVRGNNPSTRHSQHVTRLAGQLGGYLGLPTDHKRLLRWSALLMNIGQFGLGRSVLLKAGKLEDEEMHLVRCHPHRSSDLLARIEGFAPLAEVVAAHHENWDGSGYPNRMSGERIPVAARIIRAADSFTAMTTDRPYMKRKELRRSQRELRRQATQQFDPRVVEALSQAVTQ